MRKSLRCLGLAAALGCATWLGMTPVAEAIVPPSCDYLFNRYCRDQFETRACTWANGEPGVCACEANRWTC